jgi:hypothetical protein
MTRHLLLLLPVLALFAAGCYYDSGETLYPSLTSACDTANVTFSGAITPLLAGSCFSCHSNANAASFGDNLHLENYQDVVNAFPRLSLAVNHLPGAVPMPKNGAQLGDCALRQLAIWQRNGFPR